MLGICAIPHVRDERSSNVSKGSLDARSLLDSAACQRFSMFDGCPAWNVVCMALSPTLLRFLPTNNLLFTATAQSRHSGSCMQQGFSYPRVQKIYLPCIEQDGPCMERETCCVGGSLAQQSSKPKVDSPSGHWHGLLESVGVGVGRCATTECMMECNVPRCAVTAGKHI